MQNSKETEHLPSCEYATSFAGFEAALGNIPGSFDTVTPLWWRDHRTDGGRWAARTQVPTRR